VVGLISLLVMLSVGIGTILYVNQIETVVWRSRQGEAARFAAERISLFIQSVENASLLSEQFLDRDDAQHPDALTQLIQNAPAIREIVYVGSNGKVLKHAERDRPILSDVFTISRSLWFQESLMGHIYYSDVYTSPQGVYYLILSMPTHHGGVLAILLDLDLLRSVVGNIHFGQSGKVYIINGRGEIIAHTDNRVQSLHSNLTSNPEFVPIYQDPEHEHFTQGLDFDGVEVVRAAAPVNHAGWIIITELPLAEAYAYSRYTALSLTTAIIALIILLTSIIIFLINRWVLKPVTSLRDGALRIGRGELNYRIADPLADEIGQVMVAFNDMAENMQARNNQLAEQAEILSGEVQQRQKAQAELMIIQAGLEQRVQDRTRELEHANRQLSIEVQERTHQEQVIQTQLNEKAVLLKEIHHRVKNNLQIVSSLLNLQSAKVSDPTTLASLRDSQYRIHSMAMIHEQLYQFEDLANVKFGAYIRNLTNYLSRSYLGDTRRISIRIECDEINLDMDRAVPCGLIVNELVSNAFKYAYPDRQSGEICVGLHEIQPEMIELTVADDGAGLPDGIDFHRSTSLGLRLVNNLTRQLEGRISFDGQSGTKVTIRFPRNRQS
jgi:two-component sensor histidine kinase